MAALTKDRRIVAKSTNRSIALSVAPGVQIFLGALVAVNAEGLAKPAENVVGERFIGVAQEHVDNREPGVLPVRVRVQKGVFKLANSAASPLGQVHVGSQVFAEDDQTVATAGDVAVGVFDGFNEDGDVWVYIA